MVASGYKETAALKVDNGLYRRDSYLVQMLMTCGKLPN